MSWAWCIDAISSVGFVDVERLHPPSDMTPTNRPNRFPGVDFRGTGSNRRPWLLGTALDVWQVVDAYRDFGSIARMVEESDLDEGLVRLALAYYEAFPAEIDAAIRENRRPLEELRHEFPSVDIVATGT